jgi:hypothetical protein
MTLHDTQTGSILDRAENQAGLAERIECHIESRLCGRIHNLHVVCWGDLLFLQGRSRTYHAKQLAQEAALDLTDSPSQLVNHIVVSRPGRVQSRKEGHDHQFFDGRCDAG